MELIFYSQAAQLLGVKVDTLRHAVSRGALTRGPRKGHSQSLIKEQVMLYVGLNPRTGHKKQLALDTLSPAEQEQWKRYAAHAATWSTSPVTPQREEIKALVQAEVAQREEQLGETFASFLMQMGQFFKSDIMPRVREEAQKSEVPQDLNFTIAG